jgi:hypothetical protein
MMHSFVAGGLATNIEHTKDAFMLLSRMVAFFHCHFVGSSTDDSDDMELDMGELLLRLFVLFNNIQSTGPGNPMHHLPDITTFDGILDLASLCCLMELGNALNYWTYIGNAGNNHPERHQLIYARKCARSLLGWLFDHWELVDGSNNPIDAMREFYWPFLAQQARALVRYKEAAVMNQIEGRLVPEDCTFKAVKKAVEDCVMTPPELWNLYYKSTSVGDDLPSGESTNDCTFAWKGPHFNVRKIANRPTRKSERK